VVHLLRLQPLLELLVELLEQGKARGTFLTSPLGANFDPRGEVVPQE
jgi:hypothetical protein